MALARIPDTVRRVFTEAFTARDVAEPLASFDAGAPALDVLDFMRARDFDVVGVRRDGHVVGYVERNRLGQGTCAQYRQELPGDAVVSDAAPLMTVLTKLNEVPFLFVTTLGGVGGVIARADLQKPPVRMWLFGIVTLIEMRCTELIARHCPEETWPQYLSEARLDKARSLLAERARRNQRLGLLDCLQFSDKGQIIARNEEVRRLTVFASRRQADEAVKRLEQLRNNLAHAQDIPASDWEMIVPLCEFIDRR